MNGNPEKGRAAAAAVAAAAAAAGTDAGTGDSGKTPFHLAVQSEVC